MCLSDGYVVGYGCGFDDVMNLAIWVAAAFAAWAGATAKIISFCNENAECGYQMLPGDSAHLVPVPPELQATRDAVMFDANTYLHSVDNVLFELYQGKIVIAVLQNPQDAAVNAQVHRLLAHIKHHNLQQAWTIALSHDPETSDGDARSYFWSATAAAAEWQQR